MRLSSITIILVLSFALVVVCCTRKQTPPQAAQTPQPTPLTQSTQVTQINRSCTPIFQLANIQPLACYIDNNHMIGIGNASATPIPKGTTVSFSAKLVNAGIYCTTVQTREPIPPHLFITITGQPLLDEQAPCQAWREIPRVVHP